MSAKLGRPWQTTGEWAKICTFFGPACAGSNRSYSEPTASGSFWPALAPDPVNTHAVGSTITMSAWTGLHSYCWPIISLSGRDTGASRQFTVVSTEFVAWMGSSVADL